MSGVNISYSVYSMYIFLKYGINHIFEICQNNCIEAVTLKFKYNVSTVLGFYDNK